MLLKQQAFASTESHQGTNEEFQYAYRRNHALLQFLPLKLAEWIPKNLADELRMRPASGEDWSSAQLNQILTGCLVSDRRGNNFHTFHTVEFGSDLFLPVMLKACLLCVFRSTWPVGIGSSTTFVERMLRCVICVCFDATQS